MRDVRPRIRGAVTQLIRATLCAFAAAFALLAASPPPAPQPVQTRVDLTKIQPKALLPKVPLHTEFVVAINKLGQVTKILSGKPSADKTFNMQTAGNAVQAFIRTPDGKAIPGTYRLTYDYSPQTTRIHRDVTLLKEGGVDVNAEGAALLMIDDVRKRAKPHPGETGPPPPPQQQQRGLVPPPGASSKPLPDLQQILKTPPPP